MKFDNPYWVHEGDDLPGYDFNREIVAPGLLDTYPAGVIGIRVDDDFWSVAALPFEEYRDKSIQEMVAEFWPQIEAPEFGEDVTATKEQIELDRKVAEAMEKCKAKP